MTELVDEELGDEEVVGGLLFATIATATAGRYSGR